MSVCACHGRLGGAGVQLLGASVSQAGLCLCVSVRQRASCVGGAGHCLREQGGKHQLRSLASAAGRDEPAAGPALAAAAQNAPSPLHTCAGACMTQVSNYLAGVTLRSVGQVFSNAQEVMSWLSHGAACAARAGQPVSWTSPMGFPIKQPYYKVRRRRARRPGELASGERHPRRRTEAAHSLDRQAPRRLLWSAASLSALRRLCPLFFLVCFPFLSCRRSRRPRTGGARPRRPPAPRGPRWTGARSARPSLPTTCTAWTPRT